MDWVANGDKFIGLKVKGNSMYPKYIEDDTIIVKLQPDCESGQDAIVYVNGYMERKSYGKRKKIYSLH